MPWDQRGRRSERRRLPGVRTHERRRRCEPEIPRPGQVRRRFFRATVPQFVYHKIFVRMNF